MKEGDQYCPHCGADLIKEKTRVEVSPRHRYVDERKACFGPAGSGTGIWGALSGGVFLIGLAALWYFDFWWPGILFLIALMIIIGGIVSYLRR